MDVNIVELHARARAFFNILIKQSEPKALTKLELERTHWSAKIKGIGYWHVVAEIEDLPDLAAQFEQGTIYEIGSARKLISV